MVQHGGVSTRLRTVVLLRTLAVALVLMLTGLLWAGAPAWAHTRLVSLSPADGATLSAAPAEVVLTFDEPPKAELSVVQVTGPGGASATSGSPRLQGPAIHQPLLTGLGSGAYAVAWKAVSDDGHPVSGTSRFTVSGSRSVSVPAPSTNVSTTPATTAAGAASSAFGVRSVGFWVVALAVAVVGRLGAVWLLRRRHPAHGADD